MTAPAVETLRRLHRELLSAVLTAYRWSYLDPAWTFERPWIDGTPRYVPSLEARRELLGRLAALDATRFEPESALSLERIVPLISRQPRAPKAPLAAASEAGVRISAERLDAVLEHGVRSGAVQRQDRRAGPGFIAAPGP